MKHMKSLLAMLLILEVLLSMPGSSILAVAEDEVSAEEYIDEPEAVEDVDEPEAVDAPKVTDPPECVDVLDDVDVPENDNSPEGVEEANNESIKETEEETISFNASLSPSWIELTQMEMENATIISDVGSYSVTVSEGECAFLCFTPGKAGKYVLTSFSDGDTYAYLYDANGMSLTEDDDGGNNRNFLVSYQLQKDQTYYFGICFYYDNDSGMIPIRLELINTGWNNLFDEWYYFDEDGNYVTGFQTIDGKQYFFDWNGRRAYSRMVIDEENQKLFIADEDGILIPVPAGWYKYGEEEETYWYIVDDAGSYAFSEVRNINGKQYFFDFNGEMAHGRSISYDGKTYIADSSGVLTEAKEGWNKTEDSWIYIKDGEAYHGFFTDGGFTYYLNPNMLTNSIIVMETEKAYFFDEKGHMVKNGWGRRTFDYTAQVYWYYAGSDGALLTGWQKINGIWYYFNLYDYYMCIDVQTIKGTGYFFSESGAMETGWCQQTNGLGDGDWYYAGSDGALLTGWQKINGIWYYFDPYHYYMYRGAHLIDGKKYYFSESGAWVNKEGWQSILFTLSNGKETKVWYYNDASGIPVTGWKKINGIWYYFDIRNGGMYQGVQEVDGELYFFTSSGAWVSQEGWQSFLYSEYYSDYYGVPKKVWVYVNSNGRLATGWRQVGSSQYYFEEETGFMWNGRTYYIDDGYRLFSASGAYLSTAGWQSLPYTVNNTTYKEWYYINPDGTVVTGWKTIGGKDYYFESGYGSEGYNIGRMYSDGWHWIDGEEEFFDPSGACKTNVGWVTVDGYTRYRKSDGNYATGWYKVENIYYYFDNNGNMQTGWIKYGNSWYYCDPEMYTNSVVYQNGKYYYIEASGAMKASKGWVSFKYGETDGTVQQFWLYVKDSSGVLANNEWVQVNGKWYYFVPYMVTNRWVYDNGYAYYFGSDGVWTGEKREAYSSSAGYAVTEAGEEADYAVASVFAADGDYVWQGVA